MCDRLVLDSSERDDRHGALLDAHMTADALILLEHQLKHGETGCAEIMDRDLTGVTAASISAIHQCGPDCSGRPRARHSPSGARRENRAFKRALMKPTSDIIDSRSLRCLVERVTFHNADNGFCVLRGERRAAIMSRGPQATPIKLEAIRTGRGTSTLVPNWRCGEVTACDSGARCARCDLRFAQNVVDVAAQFMRGGRLGSIRPECGRSIRVLHVTEGWIGARAPQGEFVHVGICANRMAPCLNSMSASGAFAFGR